MIQGLIIFKTIPNNQTAYSGQQIGNQCSETYTWIYEGFTIENIYEQFMNDYKYLNESASHMIIFSTLNYEDYQGNSMIKIRTS